MQAQMLRRPLCLILVLIGFSFGCGENRHGRKAVSGTIQLKGNPLEYGSIEFRPVGKNGGIGTGTIVTKGRYVIPEKKGLPEGSYEVRINSTEADSSPPDPMAPPNVARNAIERIPPEYNIRTKQIVEVKADVDPVFDFDIR
ncbi:MAG: hypothetical protein QM811_17385 [Pirellulales bacterium]